MPILGIKPKPKPASKRQDEPLHSQSVYTTLSRMQRAYTVFPPAPKDSFPLFQVVTILAKPKERPGSPRVTDVNLKQVFENLQGYEQSQPWVSDIVKEFALTKSDTPTPHPEESISISKESLSSAGIALSLQVGAHAGTNASLLDSTKWKLCVQTKHSDCYMGGSKLRRLISRNDKAFFHRLLIELGSEYPSNRNERCLLAVVTKRILSEIDIEGVVETGKAAHLSAGAGPVPVFFTIGGERKKRSQGEHRDRYRVSGLHLIVFPVKCMGLNKWRCYSGIPVCDYDISDESSTLDTRSSDSFYQAQKWVLGETKFADDSDSGKVPKKVASEAVAVRASVDSTDSSALSPPSFDTAQTSFSTSWVDIDINPQERYQIASHHLNTPSSGTAEQAVAIFRSVLRKGCLEPLILAADDLSRCFSRGIGVKKDLGTARLLRYCVGILRRNYDSRNVWFPKLAKALRSSPQKAIEQRLALALLSLSNRYNLSSLRGKKLFAEDIIITADSRMIRAKGKGTSIQFRDTFSQHSRDQKSITAQAAITKPALEKPTHGLL